MRLVLLICAVVLVLPGALRADMVVELDLNGSLGDGTDSAAVALGDSLRVDVWIVGDDFVMDIFGIYVVDNGLLDMLEAEIALPGTWLGLVFESGDTVMVGAANQSNEPPSGPSLHVMRVLYRAEGVGTAALVVDLERSCYGYFEADERFTGYVGAVIDIAPPTSTEDRSWGSIKSLFR
jgi:hypothetical protein